MDVIMPFHRNDSFFYQAFDSVVASKDISLNIILVDDRQDTSLSLENLNPGIHDLNLVQTGGGIGYGGALAVGSKFLTTDMVALMNSDDLIVNSKFRSQFDALQKSDICITAMERIDKNGSKTISYAGGKIFQTYSPILLLFGAYGANATWAMHRSWWESKISLDSQPALDWRIALSTFDDAKISYIPEVLYQYRKHKTQHTAVFQGVENLQDLFVSWQKFAEKHIGNEGSREIFSVIATPWASNSIYEFNELANWLNILESHSSTFPAEMRRQVNYLIKRRLLLAALFSKTSVANRLKLLTKSQPSLITLAREFLEVRHHSAS